MGYTDRKYVIIDSSEVSSIDFSQVMQTSLDSLRYKIDGSQALVKFTGSTPSFLDGKTQYNQSEITAILNNASNGWVPDDEG